MPVKKKATTKKKVKKTRVKATLPIASKQQSKPAKPAVKPKKHGRLSTRLFVMAVVFVAAFLATTGVYVRMSHSDSHTISSNPITHPPLDPTKARISFPSIRNRADCHNGLMLNVVAHEDDDLLFINPDISHAIARHTCIRTVYVTAGDDGQPQTYWQSRENGSEAAYATMFHVPNTWHRSRASIEKHTFEISYLDADPSVALTFLRLPDGSPSGSGYAADQAEALTGLRFGTIKAIHSLDHVTSYNAKQLINTLGVIMNLDKPTVINTQAFGNELTNGDHSDHQAVGYFTDRARLSYRSSYTFIMHLGYQSGAKPPNLDANDVSFKQQAFESYVHYDTAICTIAMDCPNENTYAIYLPRHYVYKKQLIKAQ